MHHQGALAMYSVSLSKTSGLVWQQPNKVCRSLEQSILPSDGCPDPVIESAVRFYLAMCQTRRDGWVNVAVSSIFDLVGLVILRSVHLLLLFLHGTSGQLFPSAKH